LCIIHTRHMRGLSDFISEDTVEVRSLEPVPCLSYNRLEYTRACFFCCFIIVINSQPQLQKCECNTKLLKAELNVNRGYTYLQIAWPQIHWDVRSVACNVSSARKLVLETWLLHLPLRQTWQLAMDHVAFCSPWQPRWASLFPLIGWFCEAQPP